MLLNSYMEYTPTKKEFYIAISLATLGVLVFIIFSVVTFKEVGKVGDEISKTDNMEKGLENAIKIKKQMSELGNQTQTLDSFFVKSGEEAYFLEELDKLAKANGVKLATDSVGVKPVSDNSNFETLNTTIRYEGNFENVINFLRLVQDMPKSTLLSSVELRGNDGFWSGTASLSVYKIK